jgi:cation transport protein ChaC
MNDPFWVFAYGSLMWAPGFEATETRLATAYGYHRAMCLRSHNYRGTREKPGLVLGLDRGGSCHGVALRVAPGRAAAVRAYLHEREMRGGVYAERSLKIVLDDGRRVQAIAYIVRRDHLQYCGGMEPAEMAALIRTGVGARGSARDYLANTVAHIEALSLADSSLRRLLDLVDGEGKV